MTRSEAMHLAKEIDKMNYNGKYDDCQELVEKIYDDFEEQLDMEKRKAYLDVSNSNNDLIQFYLKKIALLEHCVEEAIKRPMGVEPSVWSDYKMGKLK